MRGLGLRREELHVEARLASDAWEKTTEVLHIRMLQLNLHHHFVSAIRSTFFGREENAATAAALLLLPFSDAWRATADSRVLQQRQKGRDVEQRRISGKYAVKRYPVRACTCRGYANTNTIQTRHTHARTAGR